MDFKRIVCDPRELEQYLFLPNTSADRVSKELCDIDNTQIPEIVSRLQRQIDMAKIVGMVRKIGLLQKITVFFFRSYFCLLVLAV